MGPILWDGMDENIPEIGTGKSGRPTNHESKDIDKVIRECYILGLSPAYVIQKTGLNKNTVYTKFREIDEEIKGEQATDKEAENNRRKSQHSITIDDLISRTHNMLNRVEERIESYHKKDAEIPAFLLQKFTDLTKHLLNMHQRKANLQWRKTIPDTKITYGPEWIRNA